VSPVRRRPRLGRRLDKSVLTYVNAGSTYLLCGSNTGGSSVGAGNKVYLYDSSKGGSVASAAVAIATCV